MSRPSVALGTVMATMESLPEADRRNSLDAFLRALVMCQSQPALAAARITIGMQHEPSYPFSKVPHVRYYNAFEERMRIVPEAAYIARWDSSAIHVQRVKETNA